MTLNVSGTLKPVLVMEKLPLTVPWMGMTEPLAAVTAGRFAVGV